MGIRGRIRRDSKHRVLRAGESMSRQTENISLSII